MNEIQAVTSLRRSFTRLSRFITQLMRGRLSGSPVTIQQCYALEALIDGPRTMNALAAEVGIHQSTLTRIVEKLANLGLVERARKEGNRRVVLVQLTPQGRKVHDDLDLEGQKVIAATLQLIPPQKREAIVASLDALAELLTPENEAFLSLLHGCCGTPDEGDKS